MGEVAEADLLSRDTNRCGRLSVRRAGVRCRGGPSSEPIGHVAEAPLPIQIEGASIFNDGNLIFTAGFGIHVLRNLNAKTIDGMDEVAFL